MKIHVKLFAVARDLAGSDEIVVDLPDRSTVMELRRAVLRAVPVLAPMTRQLRFAVDSEYVDDAMVLSPDSEVALIPPVSGG